MLMPPSRLYPEIISEEQRQQYRRVFDSDLAHYKSLCAEMDEISDQMHKLSREMDSLAEDSVRYQVGKTAGGQNTQHSRVPFVHIQQYELTGLA